MAQIRIKPKERQINCESRPATTRPGQRQEGNTTFLKAQPQTRVGFEEMGVIATPQKNGKLQIGCPQNRPAKADATPDTTYGI